MYLNTLSLLLTKSNYNKIKDLDEDSLKKLISMYHKVVSEFKGDYEVGKKFLNDFVENGLVSEKYKTVVDLLNKKIELHKKIIQKCEKIRDYYKFKI